MSVAENRYTPGVPRCAFTGKQVFETRAAAVAALRSWAGAKGSRQVTKQCQGCMGWHLSKGGRGKPKRSWK